MNTVPRHSPLVAGTRRPRVSIVRFLAREHVGYHDASFDVTLTDLSVPFDGRDGEPGKTVVVADDFVVVAVNSIQTPDIEKINMK